MLDPTQDGCSKKEPLGLSRAGLDRHRPVSDMQRELEHSLGA